MFVKIIGFCFGLTSLLSQANDAIKTSEQPKKGIALQAPFSQEEIKALLKESLQTRVSLSGDFDVLLNNQKLLLSRKTDSDKLTVIDIKVAENQQSFEARLEQVSGEDKIILQPLLGKIQSLTEIPALTRAIMPGEEIGEGDITWQKIPSTRLSQTFITRKEDIIGKMPLSKILQPGQPLNRSDVKAPVAIKKGEMATVSYKSEGLFLSSQAQALQDGGKGDTIRFAAGPEKKQIQAKVVGPNEAEIQPRV